MNMYHWVYRMIYYEKKKALPILAYPTVQLLYVTVKELLTDSTQQALGLRLLLDKYDMPAVISYMDLSVEAEAFGAHCVYAADEVPTITGQLIHSEAEAKALKIPEFGAGRTATNVEGLRKALRLISDRPVIGSCSGPFSVAGRLLDINEVMMDCYEEPEKVHTVLEKVTEFIIRYVTEIKRAGAQGVMMAEPLAGILSPALMEEFSSSYVKKIVDAVQDKSFIVMYHNCGNYAVQLAKQIVSTGCRVFHFGDAIRMEDILPLIPEDCLVMGNISPSQQFRNGDTESVRIATTRLLESCKKHKNFLISSGCDIPPLTEFENIDSFFETVRMFYYRQHLLDMMI